MNAARPTAPEIWCAPSTPERLNRLQQAWHAQRSLTAPRRALRELVLASLQRIDDADAKRKLRAWSAALRAIQDALDQNPQGARAVLASLHDEAVAPETERAHAQMVASFFVGLIEVADLTEAVPPSYTSLAERVNRHRAAQAETRRLLNAIRDGGLAPPSHLRALVKLIGIYSDALWHAAPAEQGYVHILRCLAGDVHDAAEGLFVYGMTLLIKGDLVRASFSFEACHVEAMRRGNRLLSALALSELLRACPSAQDRAGHPLTRSWRDSLAVWRGGGAPSERQGGAAQIHGPISEPRQLERVERAIAHARKHLQDRLTAQELAAACGVGVRTLSHDFRTVLNKTIHEAVTEVRMTLAAELLKDGSSGIQDIALRVGFQSALGFTKAFVRTFGQTPWRAGIDA